MKGAESYTSREVSYDGAKLQEIQQALRKARESLGLTQGDLLPFTGIPRSSVSLLETKSNFREFPLLDLETLRIFLEPKDSTGRPITREKLLDCLVYPDWYGIQSSPLTQALKHSGPINSLSQAIKRQIQRDDYQGRIHEWIKENSAKYGFEEKRLVDLMNGSASANPEECHRLWLFVKDDDDNRNADWIFNLCGYLQLK